MEITKKNGKQANDKDSQVVAQVVLWTLLIIILGTLLGAWVKIFWIGWVLAPFLQ